MPELNATAIATAIGGLAQPYVRALLARFTGLDPEGKARYTYVFAAAISLFSLWITGGFADFKPPADWTPLNPLPLVEYLWPTLASVFTLSHISYKATQGLVAKVAGTPA